MAAARQQSTRLAFNRKFVPLIPLRSTQILNIRKALNQKCFIPDCM